jgi:hypothetical protein
MCCFTRPVSEVRDTLIFARPEGGWRQFIVYSMQVEAKEKLAMVLPLPVPKNSGEKEVHFVDLSGYPGFFADLACGFPVPPPSDGEIVAYAGLAAKLEVQSAGSFVLPA